MSKCRKVIQTLTFTLVIVTGVLISTGCNPANGGSTLGGREEYKVLTPNTCDPADLDKLLNEYAKQGWKVRTGGWGNGFALIILAR